MNSEARESAVPVATDPHALQYKCSACGFQSHLNATRCPSCEARFAGVKCALCGTVAPAEMFECHVCPGCGVAPAPLGPEFDGIELAPDGRPMEGQYMSPTSGFLDIDSLFWLGVVAVGFFFLVPAFASGLDWNFLSTGLKWLGLIVGGVIGFFVARTVLTARATPRRFALYVGLGIAWLAVLVDALFPIAG